MAREYKMTHHGSIGVLALGHIGIRQWRKAVQAEKERVEKESMTEKKNEKKEK